MASSSFGVKLTNCFSQSIKVVLKIGADYAMND